jgi:hypothetical protein
VWGGVLTVEAVFNHSVTVHIVHDPVGILLRVSLKSYVRHGSSEDDNLIVLGELVDEANGTGSDQIVHTVLVLFLIFFTILLAFQMYEGLVQVEDQGIHRAVV